LLSSFSLRIGQKSVQFARKLLILLPTWNVVEPYVVPSNEEGRGHNH
jgi:hypothetical protein